MNDQLVAQGIGGLIFDSAVLVVLVIAGSLVGRAMGKKRKPAKMVWWPVVVAAVLGLLMILNGFAQVGRGSKLSSSVTSAKITATLSVRRSREVEDMTLVARGTRPAPSSPRQAAGLLSPSPDMDSRARQVGAAYDV